MTERTRDPYFLGWRTTLDICYIICVFSPFIIPLSKLYRSSSDSAVLIMCLSHICLSDSAILKRCERRVFIRVGPLYDHEHMSWRPQVPSKIMTS